MLEVVWAISKAIRRKPYRDRVPPFSSPDHLVRIRVSAPEILLYSAKKAENHIVGAPCGVMDQMTSSCGEANKLLAMICQPAEVIGLVKIPNHVRFWGIDSGIRHRNAITDVATS
ncbi:hypothetical protein F2Q68_00016964 [Brassica cretica]|uniref:Uncharacterized protein n=1 Tax=Brassica cretica TaxID=69181 RepID=A0A8S9HRV4_BRACR|nr:hypothetical protein F2Q68_00016964 [Brassica cretica]